MFCSRTSQTFSVRQKVSSLVLFSQQKSTLPPVSAKKINSNIQLKYIDEAGLESRPLVVLFGWMAAKPKHLNKYENLYHSKGFDVLSVKVQPSQIVMPWKTHKQADEVISTLQDSSLNLKPIMVHGFSVGGYMYSEVINKMLQNREAYHNVTDRLVGQIFDSPVDYAAVPKGLAPNITKNRALQMVVEKALESYLQIMKKPVTSHYINASNVFYSNDLKLPSLMLYSKTDPIGVAHRIELAIQTWQDKGIPVSFKCWESSPHVSHFHRHPDEYVEAVLQFLKSVNFGDSETPRLKEAQAM